MNPKQSAPLINKIKTMTVNPREQARRIDKAIARRAYQIFEQRGGTGWHELEDWRQAESEVRSKLCFSISSSDDSVLIGFDAAGFEGDSVEVWIAPRQMTICWKTFHQEQTSAAPLYEGMAFRTIALPEEIDPRRVGVNLKRNLVEIRLPKVVQKCAERSRAYAA